MKKAWLALLLSAVPQLATADLMYQVFDEEGHFLRHGVVPEGEHLKIARRYTDLELPALGRTEVTLSSSTEHALIRVDSLDDDHPIFLNNDPLREYTTTQAIHGSNLQLGSYHLALALEPPDPQAQIPGTTQASTLTRSEEFAKPSYEFCHDEDFGKYGTLGKEFCKTFDESTDEVCPQARKTCENWVDITDLSTGGGCTERRRSANGEGDDAEEQRRRYRLQFPKLSFIPQEVGIVLLALVLGVLIFWFVRSIKGAGWHNEMDFDSADLSEAELNLQALPEARSTVLLKLAKQSLHRGEGAEAAILLHLAMLRYLDDEGLVRYHPSKTNGDYLRAIRANKPLAKLFRGTANQTERLRFGDGQVDRDTVAAMLEEAQTLLRQLPSVSKGASVLVVFLMLGLSQQGCPQEIDESAKAYFKHTVIGMSALPALLEGAGLKTEVSYRKLSDPPEGTTAVVIRTSSSYRYNWPRKLRVDPLLNRGLPVLVIDDLGVNSFFMPSTATTAKEATPEVTRYQPLPTEEPSPCALKTAGLSSAPTPTLPAGRRFVLSADEKDVVASEHPLQTSVLLDYQSGDKANHPIGDPLMTGVLVAAQRRSSKNQRPMNGCLLMLSDRDLLTNASLTRIDNAQFVVRLFLSMAGPGGKVAFMERLSGGGRSSNSSSDPQEALKASNLLPLLAQCFLLLIALFIYRGAAFGPLRDPVRREHKAFVEHVEAIGRHYASTGEEGIFHAARAMARLVVTQNSDQVRGGLDALAKELAKKHELPEEDVQMIIKLSQDDEQNGISPQTLLSRKQELTRALSKMLSPRRAEGRPGHRPGRSTKKS